MPEMLLTKETDPELTIFQSDMGAARPFITQSASH